MPLRTSLQATWLQPASSGTSPEPSTPQSLVPVTAALPATSPPDSEAGAIRLELDVPTLQEPVTAPFVDQPSKPVANEAFRLSQHPTRNLDQPKEIPSSTVGLHSKPSVDPLTSPLTSRKPQLPTAGTQPLPLLPP
ncbi:MAG TPA: hypothetical protein PLB18_09025, partial [Acidobacteriota bacterium]|nr:hypothetical protein [Acidobacteriota bacterium]